MSAACVCQENVHKGPGSEGPRQEERCPGESTGKQNPGKDSVLCPLSCLTKVLLHLSI